MFWTELMNVPGTSDTLSWSCCFLQELLLRHARLPDLFINTILSILIVGCLARYRILCFSPENRVFFHYLLDLWIVDELYDS